MTGFYLLSHCIYGFTKDNGLPQRLSFYNHALDILGAHAPPSLVVPTEPVQVVVSPGQDVVLPLEFAQAVAAVDTAQVTPSSGVVVSTQPHPWYGGKTWQVTVTNATAGLVQLSLQVGAASDSHGNTNLYADTVSFSVTIGTCHTCFRSLVRLRPSLTRGGVCCAGMDNGGAGQEKSGLRGGGDAPASDAGCGAVCAAAIAGACVVAIALAVVAVRRARAAGGGSAPRVETLGSWNTDKPTLVQVTNIKPGTPPKRRRTKPRRKHSNASTRKSSISTAATGTSSHVPVDPRMCVVNNSSQSLASTGSQRSNMGAVVSGSSRTIRALSVVQDEPSPPPDAVVVDMDSGGDDQVHGAIASPRESPRAKAERKAAKKAKKRARKAKKQAKKERKMRDERRHGLDQTDPPRVDRRGYDEGSSSEAEEPVTMARRFKRGSNVSHHSRRSHRSARLGFDAARPDYDGDYDCDDHGMRASPRYPRRKSSRRSAASRSRRDSDRSRSTRGDVRRESRASHSSTMSGSRRGSQRHAW